MKNKSVFDVHKDKLEDHELMMGPVQGKLAVLLDLLTDSLVTAGQHAVYCRNKKQPEQPSLDMQAIMERLLQSKELVQSLMDQNRKESSRG